MNRKNTKKGAVVICCMIFLCVFATLAVSMATMTGTGLETADDLRKANGARACAESGHQIVRFWLSRASISGMSPTAQVFSLLVTEVQLDLAANGITNIVPTWDGSVLTIPDVPLDSEARQTFSAVISQIDPDTVRVDVTGNYRTLSKTIRINYDFDKRKHTVFDYGVASKGPLTLWGNILLAGITVAADVYIESENVSPALSIIGNSQIAGDVSITNPDADDAVDLQGGQAGIGGETGQDAIDNHVDFGAESPEFPQPNPTYFEHYATNAIDFNSTTHENIRIPAGTNPSFAAGTILKGVIFIETPNVVTFAGHVDITGIFVGDGEPTDDSGTNSMDFQGTVSNSPVSELTEPQFAGIADETGTFIMAPGFDLEFGGNFGTVGGAIAANGVKFSGNAGGTINGSILNYGDKEMVLSGTGNLLFNSSGSGETPAGFVPEIILEYIAYSYAELAG